MNFIRVISRIIFILISSSFYLYSDIIDEFSISILPNKNEMIAGLPISIPINVKNNSNKECVIENISSSLSHLYISLNINGKHLEDNQVILNIGQNYTLFKSREVKNYVINLVDYEYIFNKDGNYILTYNLPIINKETKYKRNITGKITLSVLPCNEVNLTTFINDSINSLNKVDSYDYKIIEKYLNIAFIDGLAPLYEYFLKPDWNHLDKNIFSNLLVLSREFYSYRPSLVKYLERSPNAVTQQFMRWMERNNDKISDTEMKLYSSDEIKNIINLYQAEVFNGNFDSSPDNWQFKLFESPSRKSIHENISSLNVNILKNGNKLNILFLDPNSGLNDSPLVGTLLNGKFEGKIENKRGTMLVTGKAVSPKLITGVYNGYDVKTKLSKSGSWELFKN